MALSAFEEIRARRGRLSIVGAVLLWLVAIASSTVVGLFSGLALVFTLGIALQAMAGSVGLDVNGGSLFGVGWSATVLAALVGFPAAILAADRIGPWAMGAREPDPVHPADRRIANTVRRVALAAGVDPLVLVVHEPWTDGAAFGRRGDRDVVVLSRGAALLDDRQLELLAAAVLADSIIGRGASRARTGASAPGLVPYLLVTKARQWAARRGGIGCWPVVAWIGVWTLFFLTGDITTDDGNDWIAAVILGPFMVVFFSAVMAILVAVLVGIFLVWSMLLAALALPMAARARKLADVGMAALVRAPDEWVDFLRMGAARPQHPPGWSRQLIGWVLPRDGGAAERRIEHLAEQLPGGMAALGHRLAPPPEPRR